jgi:uncharacterized protein
MSVDAQLLEILVCPKCKGDLEYREAEASLICHKDELRYPVRDDIPIMLIDEAESVDDGEHTRLLKKAETEGIAPTFEA